MEDPRHSPTNRSSNTVEEYFSSERETSKNDTFLFCTFVPCSYSELESYLFPAEIKFKPSSVFLLAVLQSMHYREQAGSPFLSIFLTIGKFCMSAYTCRQVYSPRT